MLEHTRRLSNIPEVSGTFDTRNNAIIYKL